jgi:hypothetical protein
MLESALKSIPTQIATAPNKLARILWAMMKTGESFRAEIFAKA